MGLSCTTAPCSWHREPATRPRNLTLSVETRDSLRTRHNPDQSKVFKLVRGLLKNIKDDPSTRVAVVAIRELGRPAEVGASRPLVARERWSARGIGGVGESWMTELDDSVRCIRGDRVGPSKSRWADRVDDDEEGDVGTLNA